MDRLFGLDDLAPAGALAVVAPHPDDETLGCGGLIALAARAGRRVIVILATDGAASHPGSRRWPSARLAALRVREADAALDLLSGGTVSAIPLGLPDGALESVDAREAAAALQALFALHGVTTVIAPRWDDTHPDHRAAFRMARAAAAAVAAKIWCYPVWEEKGAERTGALAVDVSSVLALKRRAIRRHRSQISRMISDAETSFRLSRSDIDRHMTARELYYPDFSEGAER